MAEKIENNSAEFEGNPNEPSTSEAQDTSGAENREENNNEGAENNSTNTEENSAKKPELKIRQHNAFFAGLRKGKKLAKQTNNEGETFDEGGSEDNPDVLDTVEKVLDPFVKQQEEAAINNDINEFLQDNPEFDEFKDVVKEYAKHPSRQNVPISTLFLEAVGVDGLKEILSKKVKEATEKKNAARTAGGSSSVEENEPDIFSMTPKEFEEYKNKKLGRI